MRVANAIKEKLEIALSPERLDITDESHKHAGHAGARPEGESHFHVEVVSAAFDGLSQVARQRMVYAALVDEMKNDIHALSLKTLSSGEK